MKASEQTSKAYYQAALDAIHDDIEGAKEKGQYPAVAALRRQANLAREALDAILEKEAEQIRTQGKPSQEEALKVIEACIGILPVNHLLTIHKAIHERLPALRDA